MSKIKSSRVRWDADAYGALSTSINDRIFMAFPIGWFVGLIAGMVYACFHWDNLQQHFGNSILIVATVSLTVAYVLSCLVIGRVCGDR